MWALKVADPENMVSHDLACYIVQRVNSFLASGDFFRLLITFVNSLDPDQDRQKVGPDLDPNRCKQFGPRSGPTESRS